ncbi:MAG TPA: hypothetical protein VFQ51_04595 [Vicinamibacteria bacterium]|nr:hypothetical protein [Vicinamibacteria bacterium]
MMGGTEWAPGLLFGAVGGMDYAPSSGRLMMLDDAQRERPAPPYKMMLFAGWGAEIDRRLQAGH